MAQTIAPETPPEDARDTRAIERPNAANDGHALNFQMSGMELPR